MRERGRTRLLLRLRLLSFTGKVEFLFPFFFLFCLSNAGFLRSFYRLFFFWGGDLTLL